MLRNTGRLLLGLALVVLATNSHSARRRPVSSPGVGVPGLSAYRKWRRVTPTPLLLPAHIAADCAAAPGLPGAPSPHRDRRFTVYVNRVGEAAMMRQERPQFPIGSVIVKEKLPLKGERPELLTVMRKRSSAGGATGDGWEYLVLAGNAAPLPRVGSDKHCRACHANQKETDYVFRSYLPDEVSQRLR